MVSTTTTHAAAVHEALALKDDTTGTLALARKKVANYSLVRRLASLIGKQQPGTSSTWSRTSLALAIGCGKNYVSIYLNQLTEDGMGEPNPDAPALPMDLEKWERALESFFAQLSERRVLSGTLYDCAITRGFTAFARQCIASRQWGVYIGPGGEGKSCAAARMAEKDPLAVLITVTQWACGAGAVASAIHAALNVGGRWRGNLNKMQWAVEQMKGTSRYLLVDNATRLHMTAFHLLADFHDATGCPIIMTASPKVREKIASDEQISSRVKQTESTSWGADKSAQRRAYNEAAEKLLLRDAPDHVADLMPLAAQVICRPGGQRSLEAHVRLAMAYLAKLPADATTDAAAAFRHAHSVLIHDGYTLD